MNKNAKKLGIYVSLLAVVIGCSSTGQSMWTRQDSWYHPPTDRGAGPYGPKQEYFFVIPTEKQGQAESLLETVPVIELSDEQARHFVSTLPPEPEGTTFYLVRSVVLNEGTGTFAVYYDQDELLVTYNCLGKRPSPMKRRCLVVPLKALPRTVYVICRMAE